MLKDSISHGSPVGTPTSVRIRKKPSLPNPCFHENNSFTTKTHVTASCELTPEPSKPRPRAQSISRCFKQSLFAGPKVVGGVDEASFLSTPGYSDKARQTYLQQCFSISKVLGEGSFGRVFRCQDKTTGEEYAIKVLQGCNKQGLEEVRKHEALPANPHCVTFYKAWEEQKKLYIQMELCDESLGCFVRRCRSRLLESEVWRILQHCLIGLVHLHSHNLLHMDIKPDNIFRCVRAQTTIYKLGDFGLAIASHDLNTSDIREGDSKYLAPELLAGTCDTKADVFSVGISMLELTANIKLPNNGVTWHELRQDGGVIPPTPGYTPALRDIILEMMTPDPEDRPPAAALLNNPNHKYYTVVNRVKDTTTSLLSSILDNFGSGGKREASRRMSDEMFEGMEAIVNDDEDDEGVRREEVKQSGKQITPILKGFTVTPNASPAIGRKFFTPSASSTAALRWHRSPGVSPGPSCHKVPLFESHQLDSSTPIKTISMEDEQLDEMAEGDPFERISLVKRNLLSSFIDTKNEDGDDDDSF